MTEQAGDKAKGMADSVASTVQPQVSPYYDSRFIDADSLVLEREIYHPEGR
jgi:hypothetical protein